MGITQGRTNFGFTGTQKGMTQQQKALLANFLEDCGTLHNGFCIGSDEECLQLLDERARLVGQQILVIAHLPLKTNKMTKFVPKYCKVEMREPKAYLERDDDIAAECGTLLATPQSAQEEIRSGTWTTVRYARKYSKPILIILPNGDLGAEPRKVKLY